MKTTPGPASGPTRRSRRLAWPLSNADQDAWVSYSVDIYQQIP